MKYCTKCNTRFALVEAKTKYKGGLYHRSCYIKAKNEEAQKAQQKEMQRQYESDIRSIPE